MKQICIEVLNKHNVELVYQLKCALYMCVLTLYVLSGYSFYISYLQLGKEGYICIQRIIKV